MYILHDLEPKYDSMVSVITGGEQLPPVQRVYSMLLTQENLIQTHIASGSTPSITLSTHSQFRSQNPTYGGGDYSRRGRVVPGNFSRFNRRNWNGSQRPRYHLCGRIGHTILRCYYRYDQGFQGPNLGFNTRRSFSGRGGGRTAHDSYTSQRTALLVQTYLNKDNFLYPDSKATNHVTNDLANLSLSTKYQEDNKVLVGKRYMSQCS